MGILIAKFALWLMLMSLVLGGFITFVKCTIEALKSFKREGFSEDFFGFGMIAMACLCAGLFCLEFMVDRYEAHFSRSDVVIEKSNTVRYE